MKTRISLLFLCSTLFASFAGGKIFEGMKVLGKTSTVGLYIYPVPDNVLGLTTQNVETTVKLELLKAGIKIDKQRAHGLNVRVHVLKQRQAAHISLEMFKRSVPYEVSTKVAGREFIPEQGTYKVLMNSPEDKDYVLSILQQKVQEFLVDYLESN